MEKDPIAILKTKPVEGIPNHPMRRLKKYINSDLVLTQLNQLWRGTSGLATLFLIPLFLTQEEQGYWFTMMSLATLSIFADLGFFNITLQFAAHEFAHLRFDGATLTGEELYKKRLASLFVFCSKWAFLVTCVAFPIILVIGFVFLGQKETSVVWVTPWAIYAAGAALTFLTSAAIYFVEGCDSVGPMQGVRLMMAVIAAASLWCGLALGWGLYALSISIFVSALFGIAVMLWRYGRLFIYFFTIARDFSFSWRSQFFSLLWRYGLSWSSGYFIFQAYTPIMFHFHGAAAAGKVGLSILLWMGVFSVANSWLYAVTPKLNMHISRREWPRLNALFSRSLVLSAIAYLCGAAVIFIGLYGLKGRIALIERLMEPFPMLCLALAWFLQIVVNGLAVYLRAHKQEPLVLPSVVSAVYIAVTTILCARYLAPQYFFLGWVSSCVWGVPWVFYIFLTKRQAWQVG